MRLYRFRSDNENTIDELNKNYFYFALPKELNDPMEGFIKLYWEGDYVLWRNFLKHYLYTFTNTLLNIYISPETIKDPLPIHFDETMLPSKEFIEIFEEIRDTFFDNKEIISFINYLTKLKHRIYIKELKQYLGFIQIITLSIIVNVLKKHSILDWTVVPVKKLDVFKQLELVMPAAETQYPQYIKYFFDAFDKVRNEMNLSFKITFKDKDKNGLKHFFINEFSNKYIDEVKSLALATPCVVSFMEDYSSPAFWGYYGNNHKGICLIFDDNEKSNEIRFDFKTTWGGIATLTQTVKYKTEFEDVNFFKMLGSLSLYAIDKFWLTDWDGNKTEYLKIGENYLTDDWRKEYNTTLFNSFTVKLPDWEKEKEHRLVIEKEMFANDSIDSRKFVYDFNLLKGVIFGFRTDDEFKIKVIDIIKSKCKTIGRNDFHFYQAGYNEKTGFIQMGEIQI